MYTCFVADLPNHAVSSSDYISPDDRMTDDMPHSRLEGRRKSRNISGRTTGVPSETQTENLSITCIECVVTTD